MSQLISNRWLISALVAFSVAYGLAVLWYVPTQPCLPVSGLLSNYRGAELPGLEVQDVSKLPDNCYGTTPALGDHIIEVAGSRIQSFADWANIHHRLRYMKNDPASMIAFGKNPSEESRFSELPYVQYQDGNRFVRTWFLRPNEPIPRDGWLPLTSVSTFNVSITLVWYILQSCVVLLGAVAFWHRPFDQSLRVFCILSAATLIAFVGGSHWWILASNPALLLIFAVAAILLPAVLLHFFLVYPFPATFVLRGRAWALASLYAVPVIAALAVGASIALSATLSRDFGAGPFADTLSRLSGEAVRHLLIVLRQIVFVIFAFELVYFFCAVGAMYRSSQTARNAMERAQVRSILWAALFAILPIGYTIYLAAFHHVQFALGAARIPMFLASLAFMLAYGIGVARFKLMLVDQIISRGIWYYSASMCLALMLALLIAVGSVNALHDDLSQFGQAVPLVLVIMTAVLLLVWGRDSLQRGLDRQFFSEKYQLDRALNRLNRVVSSVLEPEAVSESLLNSCREVLHIEQAALYLRKANRNEFRMSCAAGPANFALQVSLDPSVIDSLNENMFLQRVPHGQTPTQKLLRELRAEVVHGLEMQGQLGGLLVLGTKPNNSPYSAEDLAFISAMTRITAVALQCATVQQDVARLNQDLQLKMEKIDDQDRHLSALQNELASLSSHPGLPEPREHFQRGEIIGSSPPIVQVLETIRKVASSDSSVLLRGESGTGKELLAKAIHANSNRDEGPLISVHCAALTPSLLESELFGHAKGAFTDARQEKIGRFQMADGGTLFLDEIGDISLDIQIKLLRVLQERTFEPVGSTTPVQVDVRIVAATHRNLEQLISEGKFREDLFYRLNVISIALPALRERKEDLVELAVHFLRTASEKSNKRVLRIDETALKAIQAYSWPGNVRELQNAIERAVVLAETDVIRLADLPAAVSQQFSPTATRGAEARPAKESDPKPRPLSRPSQVSLRRRTLANSDDEKSLLQSALEQCQGNKAEAARLLDMPRSTFFSKLKKHHLQ